LRSAGLRGANRYRTRSVFARALGFALITALATGADAGGPELPAPARAALDSAVVAAVARFNADEERLRETPRVERTGPDREPYLLRATYRHADSQHQIMDIVPGSAPAVTVRVRATEFEKRATNVNSGDLAAEFAKAPWQQTARGYVLDFRLRWTGSAWETLGDPVAHPTLGTVGRLGMAHLLDSHGR
jgi:hypothetical protein